MLSLFGKVMSAEGEKVASNGVICTMVDEKMRAGSDTGKRCRSTTVSVIVPLVVPSVKLTVPGMLSVTPLVATVVAASFLPLPLNLRLEGLPAMPVPLEPPTLTEAPLVCCIETGCGTWLSRLPETTILSVMDG